MSHNYIPVPETQEALSAAIDRLISEYQERQDQKRSFEVRAGKIVETTIRISPVFGTHSRNDPA